MKDCLLVVLKTVYLNTKLMFTVITTLNTVSGCFMPSLPPSFLTLEPKTTLLICSWTKGRYLEHICHGMDSIRLRCRPFDCLYALCFFWRDARQGNRSCAGHHDHGGQSLLLESTFVLSSHFSNEEILEEKLLLTLYFFFKNQEVWFVVNRDLVFVTNRSSLDRQIIY